MKYGTLRVAMTDAPLEAAGITAVKVCIRRVDIVFDDGRPIAPLDVQRTINLLDLRDDVTTSLGIARFPVGVISQVRLILCDGRRYSSWMARRCRPRCRAATKRV